MEIEKEQTENDREREGGSEKRREEMGRKEGRGGVWGRRGSL